MVVLNDPQYSVDLSSNLSNQKMFELEHCEGVRSKALPKINKRFLTIVGPGEDVKKGLRRWGFHGDIMVVNQVAGLFPENKPYHHLVTGHCEFIEPWVKLRRVSRGHITFNEFKTHTSGHFGSKIKKHKDYIDYVWNFKPSHGSSGGLAIFIGIALGYSKILLHGLPLKHGKKYYTIDPSHCSSKFYGEMFIMMMKNGMLPKFKNIIKSSCGDTMRFFGEPTTEWIDN